MGTLTRIKALFDDDFAFQCKDNPEYASQVGQHAHHDGRLQDLSPAAFEARMQHNRSVLAQVEALAAEVQGEEGEEARRRALHLELFRKSVTDELDALSLRCHLYPVNSIGYGGVHNNFIEALDWLGDDGRAINLLSRLEAFEAQAESYKALLRQGIAEQRVASKAMVRKVPEQLSSLLKELDDTSLPSALDKLLSTVPADLSVRATAAKASFRAAIAALLSFFETDYIPAARAQEGCKGLPDGDSIYALCLRYHTTTTMSAQEVHEVGLAEVARIERRYQDQVSFRKRSPESGNYYPNKDALLESYRALVDQIKEILPSYFAKFPRSALEVVEKDVATAPAAYYMQALEDELLPPFLRFIEDRRYEFCPARRQLYAAYLEGWALYCEALGEEMGLYSDALGLFGRLSMEMMRAVRLVVDTGIHSKGWSVEEAISYMMLKTGMHRHECEAECYRYEAWPAQACAYKVGEIAIWRMRRRAEEALKDKFDLKAFHSVLLGSGPLPLDTLSSLVDEWVASY